MACYPAAMQPLLDYMKATGMSRAALARRIGYSRSLVTYWLQGKRSPSDDALDVISARTGIDRSKLHKFAPTTPHAGAARSPLECGAGRPLNGEHP